MQYKYVDIYLKHQWLWEQTDNCHVDPICTDVIGGFWCECKDEFAGNGTVCASKVGIFLDFIVLP